MSDDWREMCSAVCTRLLCCGVANAADDDEEEEEEEEDDDEYDEAISASFIAIIARTSPLNWFWCENGSKVVTEEKSIAKRQ